MPSGPAPHSQSTPSWSKGPNPGASPQHRLLPAALGSAPQDSTWAKLPPVHVFHVLSLHMGISTWCSAPGGREQAGSCTNKGISSFHLQFLPWAKQGARQQVAPAMGIPSDYKGWLRLSKISGTGRTCNYSPRACCSAVLALHQMTTFSLRICPLNFVSGETQHKHRPSLIPQPGDA